MVRRYVGARYVPVFYQNSLDPTSTEWEPNVNYEPLTIVTLPNLHSYISKKRVPATVGTPAANADYWLDQGYANAYIQALQDQIGNLANLETSVTNDLVSAVNSAVKKKYIFIGDSYAHASGSNDGWLDKIIPIMGLTSDDYYESCLGGAAFAPYGGDPTYAFLTLIQALDPIITNKEEITDIIVIGGTNDGSNSDVNTILTAVNTFTAYCYTTYPRAKIKLGMTFGTDNANMVAWRYDMVLRAYSEARNVEFMNNLQYTLIDKTLLGPDGIHPTSIGYTILSKKVLDAINGGCSVNYKETGRLTPDTDWNHDGNDFDKWTVTVNNNITELSFYSRIGITTSVAAAKKAVTYASMNKIGTLGSNIIRGVFNNLNDENAFLYTPCYANVRGNGNIYTINGILKIYRGDIYFQTFDQKCGSSSDFNAIDYIAIFPGKITANTMYV